MKIRTLALGLAIGPLMGGGVHAETTASAAGLARPLEPTPVASIIKAAQSGDSLKNGAIVGAIVGGAATFAFTMTVCRAFHEPGNPPCLKPVLLLSGAAAGGGALVGAGVDALLSRRPAVRLSVRF